MATSLDVIDAAGKKTGSVDVLKRIAAALKVDLDDIVM